MKAPLIFRREDTISPLQADYWKDLLYRVVKIGTELEVAPRKGAKRPAFEEAVRRDLSPSGSLERLGKSGVWDIQTEHCGIEIRIIGRQPYFRALQQQYTDIMQVLKKHGARPRPTCGLHFHLLTPGLAEPVPEIILANLWNLVRRYAPELKFMNSAGSSRNALTRRRNHNSHLEMVRLSPGSMSMKAIQQTLKASRPVPEHQNFLNLEHLSFTPRGDVLPFHVEFRFPDAHLSPTAITAQTFLFLALALKAVDLSQYGILHVGKTVSWQRKVEILNLLSNNDGKLATSDTSGITDEIIEELRQGCYEMLDLLVPIFDHFTDNPGLDVLLALAETPMSLMRSSGHGWDTIEERLAARTAVDDLGLDEIDYRLMQRIELGEWSASDSVEAWQWQAASDLFLTPQELERRLNRLDVLRGVRWDERQGTMVFKR
ncbi:MAG TPA: hypothetical protein ENJ02_08795 [Chloroflexi bacterium]|nr:hypothetical protein [Chloroflexota bacterium]